jgi:hypothetical protein
MEFKMTPQGQTRFSDKEKGTIGNCLVTCYASYLDLPTDDCPQFQFLFANKHPGEGWWYEVVELWLTAMGYTLKHFQHDPFFKGCTNDYYFAYGMSPRGVMHQVIYKDGKLFHDPHPSRAGVEVNGYKLLERIDGHWRFKDKGSISI